MLVKTIHNFTYSFGVFFVLDSNAQLPDLGWSAAHGKQGFCRGPNCIILAALTQYGTAELRVALNQYQDNSPFERVIEVPLEVPSGAAKVFSPDSADEPYSIDLDPGSYKVVIGQQLRSQDASEAGQELIGIYFEKLSRSLTKSRIIVCDSDLEPSAELLETMP